MKQYLYLIPLLLLVGVANAQSNNPDGVFPSDRTDFGETINMIGGVGPFRAYEETSPGVWTFRAQSVGADTFIVVDWMQPNQARVHNFVGAGETPGTGPTTTVLSNVASDGPFGDVNSQHWAVWQIQWMKDTGITSGCGGGNYCPDNNVTRAQMAVFLCNLANVLEPGTCAPAP